MRIGDVAKRAGGAVSSVRFYEDQGLMPVAVRAEGNHRLYAEADIQRLKIIVRARRFGMSMDQVRALLKASFNSEDGCAQALTLIETRLTEIRTQKRELIKLEASLLMMAQKCQSSCAPDQTGCCTIFEDIQENVAAQ